MKRRQFIKAGACVAAGLALPPVPMSQHLRKDRRKNLIYLPPNAPDLISYRKAVSIMKKLTPNDPRTPDLSWTKASDTHVAFAPHLNWWFLPWHRAFVHYFEETCRYLLQDGSFRLPYWDWTRYPFIPDPFLDPCSPLWHEGRVSTGTTQIRFDTVGAPFLDSFLSETIVGNVYGQAAEELSDDSGPGALEGIPHSAVHHTVGGDMSIPTSPLDPLFWVHHCNVDRLWESWLSLHGRGTPLDQQWAKHPLDRFYDVFSKKCVSPACSDTLESARFGAEYDQLEHFFGYQPLAILPSIQILFGPGDRIQAPGLDRVLLSATPGDRMKTKLEVTPPFRELLNNNPDSFSLNDQRSFPAFVLLLDEVPIPNKATVALRVFLNANDPGTNTVFDDPGFVGTVSVFPAFDAKMSHKATRFAFNIGPNIAKLKVAGRSLDAFEVALVSVDLVDPKATPDPVRPGKVRIAGFKASS